MRGGGEIGKKSGRYRREERAIVRLVTNDGRIKSRLEADPRMAA